MTCNVDGCDRKVKARGLCDKHYLQARRAGRLDMFAGPGRGRYSPELHKTCSGVAQCGKQQHSRGFCNACYQIRRKSGELQLLPKVNAGLTCKVDGCNNSACSLGYCGTHYNRFKKYGDPLGKAAPKTGGKCSTPECGKPVVASGLCRACYARVKKRGTTEYSERHLRRFGKVINDDGYVMVYDPSHPNAQKSKRVPEHRLVMSQHLGRALRKNENVHHKNGDRTDNRIENLELWAVTQPGGQRPQDLLKWARNIIKRYAAEDQKFSELSYRNQSE